MKCWASILPELNSQTSNAFSKLPRPGQQAAQKQAYWFASGKTSVFVLGGGPVQGFRQKHNSGMWIICLAYTSDFPWRQCALQGFWNPTGDGLVTNLSAGRELKFTRRLQLLLINYSLTIRSLLESKHVSDTFFYFSKKGLQT